METRELERQIEFEERLLACEEAIYLRDSSYSTRSTQDVRQTEARGWALVLEEVPADQIVSVTVREIKRRQKPFPPGARDVLACFRGEEWDDQGERVTAANGGMYQSWESIKARDEKALPEPLPALEIAPDELKARLRGAETSRSTQVLATEEEQLAPIPRESRESVETTLRRLELHLDDSFDRRVLVWFSAWHRQWHENHVGAQMSAENIQIDFVALCAAKIEAP